MIKRYYDFFLSHSSSDRNIAYSLYRELVNKGFVVFMDSIDKRNTNTEMQNPQIINVPKISDLRGNLSFFENDNQLPFKIKRSYWIYDVPGGESRGGHAFKTSEEFIVALSGSFDVVLDNGSEKKTYTLNRSYYGLYVPKMCWREMVNFSTNSLALIVSSTDYNADDYIRDHDEFLRLVKKS